MKFRIGESNFLKSGIFICSFLCLPNKENEPKENSPRKPTFGFIPTSRPHYLL